MWATWPKIVGGKLERISSKNSPKKFKSNGEVKANVDTIRYLIRSITSEQKFNVRLKDKQTTWTNNK